MFRNFVKKALVFFLVIVISASPAFANSLVVPAELDSYGAKIYQGARSYFGGRSFSGYCGTYVRCQLIAMGIFTENNFLRGNGNQWFSNFNNVDVTSGGYHVYREGGRDCLDNLAEKFGDELDNIVLSFPVQAGYSASYPGAGHALVIYKLKDGIAYYSESFSYGNNREGEVIAEDAQKLVERYSRRHGEPIGCVLLSENDLEAPDVEGEILAMMAESMELISDFSFLAERLIDSDVLA